jgi:SAM-dependent methyltransferase
MYLHQLRELYSLWNLHRRFTRRYAEHDFHNVFEKTIRDLRRFGFAGLDGKKVLDLGCGQRFHFALLCAAHGAIVTALDIDYIKPDPLPLAFYRTILHSGFKRAIRSALRKLLYDRYYYNYLEEVSGKNLRYYINKIHFVIADPTQAEYKLPSETFDLICSNAVLEHVVDVPNFAKEVFRMLVPGGYFYAIIHNFYSLSGGHNPEWAFPDEFPSSRVPPWDHLRKNIFPASVYLNRLRPEEYYEAFAQYLKVLLFEGRDINHDPGGFEGERFLTKEISEELSAYPRELLLTRSWCIICQKV